MAGEKLGTPAEIEAYLRKVAEGPYASYWLKGSIETLLNRDALDATRDAEFLAEWLGARAKLILAGK